MREGKGREGGATIYSTGHNEWGGEGIIGQVVSGHYTVPKALLDFPIDYKCNSFSLT